MLFHSVEFLLFFPLLLILRRLLPNRLEKDILLVASYIFYAWFSFKFVWLLAFSTVVDFILGEKIHNATEKSTKKLYLGLSLIANLGVLFLFKYWVWGANLFVDLGWGDIFHGEHLAYAIILPLGISFYTFQSMSYSLDIYLGKFKPIKEFSAFALYVAFFPQLVAGPIERARNLVPQILNGPKRIPNYVLSALSLIVWGFIKKLVFADNLSYYVDEVYSIHDFRAGLDLLLASYAFGIQIYCDFSGYTDIARGVARLMGYELMLNFNVPYLAQNIKEFWQRWHISLSTWFRDYLYIPLGGNKSIGLKRYSNLIVTMLIAGLWHGANLTFLAWGLMHGIMISIYHWWDGTKALVEKREKSFTHRFFSKSLKIFITFHLVTLSWVFFRSQTIEQALSIHYKILSLDGFAAGWQQALSDLITYSESAYLWMFIFLVITLVKYFTNIRSYLASTAFINWLALWAGIAVIIAFGSIKSADFIYFQF